MKNIFLSLFCLSLLATSVQATSHHNKSYAYEYLKINPYVEVISTLSPKLKTKKVFIQDNSVKSSKDLNRKEPYCFFENIRSQDDTKKINIKNQTLFKLTNDIGESWEQNLSYRVWQKGIFFWDNGYYQFFGCNNTYYGEEITTELLLKNVGKFLNFKKITEPTF